MNYATVCNMIALCWLLIMACYQDTGAHARKVIIHIPEESRPREHVVHKPHKYKHKHHRSHKKQHMGKDEPIYDGIYIDDSPGDEGMRGGGKFGRNNQGPSFNSFPGSFSGSDISLFQGGHSFGSTQNIVPNEFGGGNNFPFPPNMFGNSLFGADSAGASQNLIKAILAGMSQNSQNGINAQSIVKGKGVDFTGLGISETAPNVLHDTSAIANVGISNGQLLPFTQNSAHSNQPNPQLNANQYNTNPLQFPALPQSSAVQTPSLPAQTPSFDSHGATSFTLNDAIAAPAVSLTYPEIYNPTGNTAGGASSPASGASGSNSGFQPINTGEVRERSIEVMFDKMYGQKGGFHEKDHFIKVSDSPEDPMNGKWPF